MFTTRLASTLSLTLGGKRFDVPGGNLRAVSADMTSHGFNASVSFIVADNEALGGKFKDELLTDFIDTKRIDVSLLLEPEFPEPESEETASDAVIELKGIVTSRTMSESVVRVRDERMVLFRRYTVEFTDPAQALWREHFPVELHTDKTVEQVLRIHTGADIQLICDFAPLTEQLQIVFLNLEERWRASFYDFVMWYLDARNGVWTYDYETRKYTISTAPPTPKVKDNAIGLDEAHTTVRLPEPPRYKRHVLNSYTESPQNRLVENNPDAFTGIRRDALLRTQIAQPVDNRVSVDKKRMEVAKPELDMSFARFPSTAVYPGMEMTFLAQNMFTTERIMGAGKWIVHG
ncbi:MAG: hypothetical protein AAGC55_24650, partial [Myxococcota bacterium]